MNNKGVVLFKFRPSNQEFPVSENLELQNYGEKTVLPNFPEFLGLN